MERITHFVAVILNSKIKLPDLDFVNGLKIDYDPFYKYQYYFQRLLLKSLRTAESHERVQRVWRILTGLKIYIFSE